jgi:hypothetical protein
VAMAPSTSRARAWKWSITGGSLAAFLLMAQIFHAGDASRPSTPAAAADPIATGGPQAGGVTWICVEGAYGYTCAPANAYGRRGDDDFEGTYGGGFRAPSAGAFANTRSGGS